MSGSASGRWQTARAAYKGNTVTRLFKTLRDMSDGITIPFDDLEFVRSLGEGAFGIVEKRRLVDKDGHETFIAVKKLKRQDMTLDLGGRDAAMLSKTLSKLSAAASGRNSASMDRTARSAAYTVISISEGPHVAADGTTADATAPATAAGSMPEEEEDVEKLLSNMSEDDQMFMAELGVMRKLSHPYIIRYLGCGVLSDKGAAGSTPKNYIAIAQECCEGGSLGSMIARAASGGTGKRLYCYQDSLRWMTQAAKALQYLHESSPQVLHRDLKSENLLLSEPGRAGDIRVMDFGLTKLCKLVTIGWEQAQKQNERYIMTGQTGSFLYMAPEVVRCEPYDEKVDIFSLGVIMYETFLMCPMLEKVSKSGDPQEFEVYAKLVSMGQRQPLKPSWPQSLKDVIARCWHDDPKQRPSAKQLVQMLTAMDADVKVMNEKCPRDVIAVDAAIKAAQGGGKDDGCCVIS